MSCGSWNPSCLLEEFKEVLLEVKHDPFKSLVAIVLLEFPHLREVKLNAVLLLCDTVGLLAPRTD